MSHYTINYTEPAPITLEPTPPTELVVSTTLAGPRGPAGKNGRDGRDGRDADPAVTDALAADIGALAAGIFGDPTARSGVHAVIELGSDGTIPYQDKPAANIFSIHDWQPTLDPTGSWVSTTENGKSLKYWRVPVTGVYMVSVTMVVQATFLLNRIRAANNDAGTRATNFFYAGDTTREWQVASFTRVVLLSEGERLDWAYRINNDDKQGLRASYAGIRSQATIALLAPTT